MDKGHNYVPQIGRAYYPPDVARKILIPNLLSRIHLTAPVHFAKELARGSRWNSSSASVRVRRIIDKNEKYCNQKSIATWHLHEKYLQPENLNERNIFWLLSGRRCCLSEKIEKPQLQFINVWLHPDFLFAMSTLLNYWIPGSYSTHQVIFIKHLYAFIIFIHVFCPVF